jgi:type I restriction enzyme R subunit
MSITEDTVEQAALSIFADLGYAYASAGQIAPDGTAPERTAYSDVVLFDRLSAAVERLNPDVPAEACAEAIKQLFISETPSLIEENRRIHRLLTRAWTWSSRSVMARSRATRSGCSILMMSTTMTGW